MQNSAVSAYKIFIRLCIIRKFYVNLQNLWAQLKITIHVKDRNLKT